MCFALFMNTSICAHTCTCVCAYICGWFSLVRVKGSILGFVWRMQYIYYYIVIFILIYWEMLVLLIYIYIYIYIYILYIYIYIYIQTYTYIHNTYAYIWYDVDCVASINHNNVEEFLFTCIPSLHFLFLEGPPHSTGWRGENSIQVPPLLLLGGPCSDCRMVVIWGKVKGTKGRKGGRGHNGNKAE
jgi:hypothetical protein